jgi:hypothetical protein
LELHIKLFSRRDLRGKLLKRLKIPYEHPQVALKHFQVVCSRLILVEGRHSALNLRRLGRPYKRLKGKAIIFIGGVWNHFRGLLRKKGETYHPPLS